MSITAIFGARAAGAASWAEAWRPPATRASAEMDVSNCDVLTMSSPLIGGGAALGGSSTLEGRADGELERGFVLEAVPVRVEGVDEPEGDVQHRHDETQLGAGRCPEL